MNSVINIIKLFLDSGIFVGGGLQSGDPISIKSGIFAPLVDGLIPSEYLPSYVDDIIEKADYASLPDPGEAGKIYVTLNDNLTYRWSGSGYVNITNPHARQHSLQSTSDHTSEATPGALLKADANGLPVNSVVNESSGKVGFGCTNPGNIIEVKNEGISKSAIAVRRSGGSQQIIRLYENANGNGVIRALDTGANDRVFLSSDGDCYIDPINSGKLGIGVYSPSEKLEVNGNVLAKVASGSVGIIAESTATNQGGALSLKGVTTTEGQTLSTIAGYNSGTLIGALRIKRGNANNTGKLYLHTVIAGVEKEILSTDNSGNLILNEAGNQVEVSSGKFGFGGYKLCSQDVDGADSTNTFALVAKYFGGTEWASGGHLTIRIKNRRYGKYQDTVLHLNAKASSTTVGLHAAYSNFYVLSHCGNYDCKIKVKVIDGASNGLGYVEIWMDRGNQYYNAKIMYEGAFNLGTMPTSPQPTPVLEIVTPSMTTDPGGLTTPYRVSDIANTSIGGQPILNLAPDANTKIGIGVSSPSEKLDVTGNIKSSGFSSSKNTVLHSASNSATISIEHGDASTHNIDIPLQGNGGTLICKFEVYTSPTNRKQTYRCEYKYHMGWGGAGSAKITLPLNALVDATSGSIVDVSNGSVYSSTNIRIGFTGTGLASGETAYIKVTYGFAYESWELNPFQ